MAALPAVAEGSAAPKDIRLAILTADVSAAGDSVIGAELAKAFETHKRFGVLDRDHVAKILREQSLSVSGLIRRPLQAGRILGARYLVYVTSEKALVGRLMSVICVEVSSGNVVYERAARVGGKADIPKVMSVARRMSEAVATHIRKNEATRHLPSAAVLYVQNQSKSRRLDFLERQIRTVVESLLAAAGRRVLHRRYPGRLAKETTLSTVGLTRPDAKVLAEAADLVIRASFVESPSPDRAFKNTPITMTLKIGRKGHPESLHKLSFTLSGMKTLLPPLRKAIQQKDDKWAGPDSSETLRRKIEATELLAALGPIPYTTSLEEHRRQVKLAKRVIYLDPMAKDAYFLLGFSLDACIRKPKPWKLRETLPLCKEAVAAFGGYLTFPRTDRDRVHEAFRGWVGYRHLLNQDKPQRALADMTEWIRWQHSADPVHSPRVHRPDWSFDRWWERHPAERVAFYTWVDELYKGSRDLSCFPLELALAYDELGKYAKAARYLHETIILAKRRPGVLGYLLRNARYRFAGARVERLLKHSDRKQAEGIRAGFGGKEAGKLDIAAMHGQAYGTFKSLHDYSRRADRITLRTFNCRALKPQSVNGGPSGRCVIVRLTDAGLWVQAMTPGKLAMYLSAAPGKWRQIPLPKAMEEILGTDDGGQNHVISIVQVGKEVLFATPGSGVYVYDLRRATWRHLGMKEGLGSDRVAGMAPGSAGRGVWIYGGRFLCRYRDGKVFGWKTTIPSGMLGMHAYADRMYLLESHNNEDLVALSQAHPKARKVLTQRQQRRLIAVPEFFRGPSRSFNAGIYSNRRLVGRNGNMYMVNRHGLLRVTAQGKPIGQWYPSGFYHWNELGGWVQGNCPLPPCSLKEAVPDDEDPNRLWLLSKHNATRTAYLLWYMRYPSYRSLAVDESIAFITAYDVKKSLFSKPIRIKGATVAHIQPRGKDVYMTGARLRRLPKKTWVLDQPGRLKDTPLRVRCPETLLGKASAALFNQEFDRAGKLLQEALDAGISTQHVKQMLGAMDKLKKAKEQ